MDRIFFVAPQVVAVHGLSNRRWDPEKDRQNDEIDDGTEHSIFELEILKRDGTGFLHQTHAENLKS